MVSFLHQSKDLRFFFLRYFSDLQTPKRSERKIFVFTKNTFYLIRFISFLYTQLPPPPPPPHTHTHPFPISLSLSLTHTHILSLFLLYSAAHDWPTIAIQPYVHSSAFSYYDFFSCASTKELCLDHAVPTI